MGKFNLAIPRPVWGRSGPSWDEADLTGFEHVFVAPDLESYFTLQFLLCIVSNCVVVLYITLNAIY